MYDYEFNANLTARLQIRHSPPHNPYRKAEHYGWVPPHKRLFPGHSSDQRVQDLLPISKADWNEVGRGGGGSMIGLESNLKTSFLLKLQTRRF